MTTTRVGLARGAVLLAAILALAPASARAGDDVHLVSTPRPAAVGASTPSPVATEVRAIPARPLAPPPVAATTIPAAPSPEPTSPPATPTTVVAEERGAVLLAAGDIAACYSDGDEATAELLDRLPGDILALGDQAYQQGSAANFALCYGPSWGRHKARTRAIPGNVEYRDPEAAAYFAYFGGAAGTPGKGYYSFEEGAWHVVALNANCDEVGGCQAGSPQERWLRADLAAHPAECTLAAWHQRTFSSDQGSPETLPLWRALYEAGAEIVLTGHSHVYERLAPLDAYGNPDPERGLREFVVGTGGASHGEFRQPLPASEARNADTFGVLELTLLKDSYSWRFVPEAGHGFTDAGAGRCHAPPSPAASGQAGPEGEAGPLGPLAPIGALARGLLDRLGTLLA